MRSIQTPLQGVWLLESNVFRDVRGAFEVNWDEKLLTELNIVFSPSSAHHSYNAKNGTLRGFHFQKHPHGQAKLVSCVTGRTMDVVVDLRRDSVSFGKWHAFELTAASGTSIYIPAGCAHGFLTLDANTTIAYLIEGDYLPAAGRVLRWDDQRVGVTWPRSNPILSDKDATAPGWEECDF
jgi:dTDP-4-dehydrorhamnose 3,5-epimerase